MAAARTITLVISIASFSTTAAYFLWLLLTQVISLLFKDETSQDRTIQSPNVRFAVLVCARNEERVIGRLIRSLQAQHYDSSLYDIYVVAHNCTDQTECIARRCGARVFVLDASEMRRKADALTHGITEIRRLPRTYDAFAFFDADNVADPSFLAEGARALRGGSDVVQGKYCSCNYHANAISELSGALWLQTFYTQIETFTRIDLPVLIYGTGFVMSATTLDPNGWPTHTLVEDFEMSVLLALKGVRLAGSARMRTYAEQPVRLRDALEQRKRWVVGDMQCLVRYFLPTLKSLRHTGLRGLKVLVDLLLNVALIGFAAGLTFAIAHLLLLGLSVPRILAVVCLMRVAFWCIMSVQTLILFYKERLRVRDNLVTLVWFPLWTLVSVYFACYALYVRNVDWRRTPHSGEGVDIA